MSKHKTIKSEDLKRLLDEYRIDNPDAKITIPLFGTYIRNKGYNVPDYTIRRDSLFRKYLESVTQDAEEELFQELVFYKTTDVEAFMKQHNTKEKMKSAIQAKDAYYAKVAANAVKAFQEKKAGEEKIKQLEKRIEELETKLSQVQISADNKEIKKKNAIIIKLRKLLESYVYPDVANALLEREGLLDVLNTLVPEEIIEKKVIHANSDLNMSEFQTITNLLEGFSDN